MIGRNGLSPRDVCLGGSGSAMTNTMSEHKWLSCLHQNRLDKSSLTDFVVVPLNLRQYLLEERCCVDRLPAACDELDQKVGILVVRPARAKNVVNVRWELRWK